MAQTAPSLAGRAPSQLIGGWEAGLFLLILLLYFGGAVVNPTFFGSTEALSRGAARQRPRTASWPSA